jgi:TRAP-type C4-dicarboxylate transport system substrate-binding protein
MGVLIVDKKAFDKLSATDQSALREEMNKAFAKLDQINLDDNRKAMETLKGQGIGVHTPTAEEQKLWQNTGVDAMKQLESEKAVTPELLKQLNDVIATVRKK